MFEIPTYHHRLPNSYPEAIPSTSNYRLKLNVCGGISFKGPTDFAVFKENLDSQMYKQIIEEIFAPFKAENYCLHMQLHQDNDRKHSSALCKEALELFGINWVNPMALIGIN